MKISSPVARKRTRIEIVPLIDIMFFLLASFMMVSLQMEQTRNIKVNLPDAVTAAPDFKPGLMNIAVDKEGTVWLEKQKVTLPELGYALSNRFRLDTNLPVYLSGDRDALEGDIAAVLKTVRMAGVQRVAFMTEGGAASPAKP